jgi:hypothetical protein
MDRITERKDAAIRGNKVVPASIRRGGNSDDRAVEDRREAAEVRRITAGHDKALIVGHPVAVTVARRRHADYRSGRKRAVTGGTGGMADRAIRRQGRVQWGDPQ